MASDFASVCYYVVRFHEVPDVLCSAGQFPLFDFDGARLQNLMVLGGVPDHLTFSLIATDTGGVAVFSWLGDNPASEKLVKSLHRKGDAELVRALVRYVFEFFENAYLKPSWWDALDHRVKLGIRNRVTIAMDMHETRRNDCLRDDGLVTVHWTVAKRETNLAL